MEGASRRSIDVWICTPQDLEARGDEVWASAKEINSNPWLSILKNECLPLAEFNCIWMRKDPP